MAWKRHQFPQEEYEEIEESAPEVWSTGEQPLSRKFSQPLHWEKLRTTSLVED